ncbi:response regulator [Alcanivorax sp.]|uniref:hybrid sensor histidine kinase/response regulator n=1 Tax=Alcanivorax sp. TaxID=1872427 RepID=UPI0032D90FF5
MQQKKSILRLYRPKPLFFLLVLVLWASTNAVFADIPPPFVVHSEPDQARITIYSEYYPDTNEEGDISTIRQPPISNHFQPATRYIERLGISDGKWWVRVALQNELSNKQDFALTLKGNPDARVFQPDSDGHYHQAGKEQRIPGRDVSYRLHLPTGEPQLIYLQLQPHGHLTYGLTLNSINAHLEKQSASTAVYMVLTGALLILAIYNLIAGIMRGGKTYFYHCGFILGILAISLILAGFLPLSLTENSSVQPRILFTMMMLTLFSTAGVARSFFDLSEIAPLLHRSTQLLKWGALALIPLTLVLPVTLAASISFVSVSLAAFLLLFLGYTCWHWELNGGGLFFFTTVLVSGPTMLVCLAYLGVLQTNAELPQWLLASTILEAVTLGVGLRVSHRHRALLHIEQTRSQAVAETVDATRRETLSRIGHDVRTPLSGILGMAEILADTPLTPNQRECVSSIQNAGDNLLRIINDVLEHSQLSTRGTDINHSVLDIHDLIMEAIDLFKERSEEKQIELITHVHTNVPTRVIGDAGRLRQIVTNLMGALIRHGHPGELVVDVSMEPTGQADRVRFGFTGSAMSEETLNRLRDNQKQSESSHLSLAIAEQLVEVLGGRLGTLRDNRDVHYWFVVPLPAENSPTPSSNVDTSQLAGRSLLVVDDSTTVTRVLRHHALSWGMRVTACHDPREALASLRTQANINEPYDIVVLDHHMPGMDGMQLAARIHEDPVIVHPTVLVMLTGINNAPTATQARNVGIHRVLSKPVSAPRLRQALAEELGLGKQSPDSPPQPPHQPDPGLKLLVAEDHYLSQKVIRGMLGKLGLKADIASNGKEALELASKTRYDLILMDCEMPEMDGFEATRMIREHEQKQALPAVPIVALTAHILREHKDRSLAAGMNAHLPKPVELNVLRDTLVRFTQTHKTDATPQLANDGTPD